VIPLTFNRFNSVPDSELGTGTCFIKKVLEIVKLCILMSKFQCSLIEEAENCGENVKDVVNLQMMLI